MQTQQKIQDEIQTGKQAARITPACGISIDIQSVGKVYAGRPLFGKVSACIQPGECAVIKGKNGAGKSTLLKIIAGLLRPSAGAVHFWAGSKELNKAERLAAVGLMSPETEMYSQLSGYENLLFWSKVRGLTLSAAELSTCLDFVGLTKQQQYLTGTYSTGMRQRLKLAILLALRPAVLLLDEPSANLDQAGRQLVKAILQLVLKAGTTVCVATNEEEEARDAAVVLELV